MLPSVKNVKLHPRFESLPAEAEDRCIHVTGPISSLAHAFSSWGHAASGNRRPSWSGPGLLPPPASFPKRCAFGRRSSSSSMSILCPWGLLHFWCPLSSSSHSLSGSKKSSVCFTSFGLSAFAFGACRFSIPSRPPLCSRSKQGQHHEGSLLLAVSQTPALPAEDTRRHSHILLFRAMCSVL